MLTIDQVKSALHVGEEIRNYKALCEKLGQIVKTSDSKAKQLKDFRSLFDWEQNGHKIIITAIHDSYNIWEGEVFSNFEALCRCTLGEEPKRGNAKKAQLKRIESQYKIEKFGQQYKIHEIYSDPREIEDGRKNNRGSNNHKYDVGIEQLIMNGLWLVGGYMRTTTKELIKMCALYSSTNPMKVGVYNSKYASDKYKVTSGDLKRFYMDRYQKSREIVLNALDGMIRRGIVTVNKQLILNIKHGDVVVKTEADEQQTKIYESVKPMH